MWRSVRRKLDTILRCFGLLGMYSAWAAVAALCVPSIRPHFLNLLYRSLVAFTNFKNTTPWAFISFDLVQPVLLLVFFVVLLHKSHGGDAVRIHWTKEGIIGLKAIALLVIFYYVPMVLWRGTYIVWEDHYNLTKKLQAEEQANRVLATENERLGNQVAVGFGDAKKQCELDKDSEIKRLKEQRNAVCYRPDRRLTAEDHSVIFAALQKLAEEAKKNNAVPSVRFMCFCQDREVSSFMNDQLWPIFRNAGWTMRVDVPSAKLTAEQIQKNWESQRSWIYQAGLDEGVMVFDKDAKGFGFALSMPFYERGYGGMWDQRHTLLPNVDGLTLWVGFKSTR
jgi:hypothetical protein